MKMEMLQYIKTSGTSIELIPFDFVYKLSFIICKLKKKTEKENEESNAGWFHWSNGWKHKVLGENLYGNYLVV